MSPWLSANNNIIVIVLMPCCHVHDGPSVLWYCWLGVRNSIRPVKLSDEVLLWLSLWSEVQIVCIYGPTDATDIPKTPSSLASFKSRLVLPFWYRPTQVVLEKKPGLAMANRRIKNIGLQEPFSTFLLHRSRPKTSRQRARPKSRFLKQSLETRLETKMQVSKTPSLPSRSLNVTDTGTVQ